MKIFFLLSVVVSALLMSGVEAQSSPLLANCADMRKQFEFRKVRLFTNAQGTDGIVDELCYDNQLGLIRYYHCQKGFTAVVQSDPGNFFTIVDVAQLRNQRNTKDVLTCLNPDTPRTNPSTPPLVGSCSTAGPLLKANQYLLRDHNAPNSQPVLCERSCSVGTSVLGGNSIESRLRTFVTCCDGQQPRLISQASRLFSCSLLV